MARFTGFPLSGCSGYTTVVVELKGIKVNWGLLVKYVSYWGVVLLAVASAVVCASSGVKVAAEVVPSWGSATSFEKEPVELKALTELRVGGSRGRPKLLRGVGCEGAEVVVSGVGEEAHVEGSWGVAGGAQVFMGAGFFEGRWSESEVCGVYWHERGHVELGHVRELREVDANRRVEQELEADAYGQRELARRGGGLCGLYGALKKVYNGNVGSSADYPSLELRLGRLREWGGCE